MVEIVGGRLSASMARANIFIMLTLQCDVFVKTYAQYKSRARDSEM
jgi:hypothetical protein